MSWIPIGAGRWPRRHIGESAEKTGSISPLLRVAGIGLRTVFIVALLMVTVQVAQPQNETIWTAYETPGDLIRLTLGFAVCLWIAAQLFIVPRDAQAYRTWIYLGLAAIPLVVIFLVIW